MAKESGAKWGRTRTRIQGVVRNLDMTPALAAAADLDFWSARRNPPRAISELQLNISPTHAHFCYSSSFGLCLSVCPAFSFAFIPRSSPQNHMKPAVVSDQKYRAAFMHGALSSFTFLSCFPHDPECLRSEFNAITSGFV